MCVLARTRIHVRGAVRALCVAMHGVVSLASRPSGCAMRPMILYTESMDTSYYVDEYPVGNLLFLFVLRGISY